MMFREVPWRSILLTPLLLQRPICEARDSDQSSLLRRAQQPGLWLPEDHHVQQAWLAEKKRYVDVNPAEFHPVVVELRDLVLNDTHISMMANGMYDDIPGNYSDPSGWPVIRNFTAMLEVMNHLLTVSPEWTESQYNVGLVGLPMHALVDWPMGTFYGRDFFLDSRVNVALKRVINEWAAFLASPASAYVLNNSTTGWFGPTAMETLTATANVDGTSYSFEELFVSDPTSERYGFDSWDAFFTREFREGVRPIAAPDNDSVIANVCESLPFALASNVKYRDEFWVKGQPYSLTDMLGGDELSGQFIGGTIYQAYLSSVSYHRWHSPVSGRIVKTTSFNGTYYSEPLFRVLEAYGAVPKSPRYAQGYLTAVATRAVIYIQADNPDIGLMAVVLVGMSEVSSNEVKVNVGQSVKKGDEIGMFHFGGSTHCVLFRPGVKLSGFPVSGERTENVPVRGQLAVVEAS